MDYRILHIFTDYYDQLKNEHLVEGCIGVSNQDEITVLNACLASIYTLNKLSKEEKK